MLKITVEISGKDSAGIQREYKIAYAFLDVVQNVNDIRTRFFDRMDGVFETTVTNYNRLKDPVWKLIWLALNEHFKETE